MTICAKCQRPIADGDGSVQYREVVGLQEWTVWTYHAACAPPNEAGSGTLGSRASRRTRANVVPRRVNRRDPMRRRDDSRPQALLSR